MIRILGRPAGGIFHLAGPHVYSRYEFLQTVCFTREAPGSFCLRCIAREMNAYRVPSTLHFTPGACNRSGKRRTYGTGSVRREVVSARPRRISAPCTLRWGWRLSCLIALEAFWRPGTGCLTMVLLRRLTLNAGPSRTALNFGGWRRLMRAGASRSISRVRWRIGMHLTRRFGTSCHGCSRRSRWRWSIMERPRPFGFGCGNTGWPGFFAVLANSEELGVRKPDIAFYSEVSRRLGVSPAKCLLIDDDQHNLDGAVRSDATIRTIEWLLYSVSAFSILPHNIGPDSGRNARSATSLLVRHD